MNSPGMQGGGDHRATRMIGLLTVALAGALAGGTAAAYEVVDTGQDQCFGSELPIDCPDPGEPFRGQDAQYEGAAPSFEVGDDGLTVFDLQTGLTWVQCPDTNGDGLLDSSDKLTWPELGAYPAVLNAQSFGGFDDWRVPTIKELYSLIDFRGLDPSGWQGGTEDLVPFIDTAYFDFVYGDESAGERLIDAQYWSATEYVGTIFHGDAAVFGVNFADGRIKGYPRDNGPGGAMTQFARLVRGNADYAHNEFVDNGDGTVTDLATGLMWMQADCGEGLDWEAALAYAEGLDYADYDDWRLPNAKELQSIVDYTRSPQATGSPAIDPLFSCSAIIDEAGDENYPFYWTSTTHINLSEVPGSYGAYVAFGEALGYFGPPGMEAWVDVHGAGAQRSDPKAGDPGQWPYGHGPQGDAIRIYNHVRCVRDADASSDTTDPGTAPPGELGLRIAPNPMVGETAISFALPVGETATVEVLDAAGRAVGTYTAEAGAGGRGQVTWDATRSDGRAVAPGVYFARVRAPGASGLARILVLR